MSSTRSSYMSIYQKIKLCSLSITMKLCKCAQIQHYLFWAAVYNRNPRQTICQLDHAPPTKYLLQKDMLFGEWPSCIISCWSACLCCWSSLSYAFSQSLCWKEELLTPSHCPRSRLLVCSQTPSSVPSQQTTETRKDPTWPNLTLTSEYLLMLSCFSLRHMLHKVYKYYVKSTPL